MGFRRAPSDSDGQLRCSFCHKDEKGAGKLISSPSDYPRAYICSECVAVCNSILEDDKPGPESAAETPEIQHLREEIRLLLDQIPDRDLATVAKILHALI